MTDEQNENYKFSRKFEMSVLGISNTVKLLNDRFVCRKIGLPAEADMKVAKNQARIEIYGATRTLLGTIGRDDGAVESPNAFSAFLQARLARSQALAKKEIARLEKEIAARAAAEKERRKDTEVADAK